MFLTGVRTERVPEDAIPGIVNEIPWQAMGAKANLGRFGFKISRFIDDSKNSPEDSLVKFEMNNITAEIGLETDGKLTTKILLKSIILEDTRGYSPNIHRRLVAPTTHSEKENQLEVVLVVLPNSDMDIRINMFAPRFFLLPDITTELCVHVMHVVSKFQSALEEFTTLTQVESEQKPVEGVVVVPEYRAPAAHVDIQIALKSPEIVAMEDSKRKGLSIIPISISLSASVSVCLPASSPAPSTVTSLSLTLNMNEFSTFSKLLPM